jgi:glutaconate CoA-transferase, subunit A
VAENGARPLTLPDHYPVDAAHLRDYAQRAKTAEGFARYLDEHVYGKRAA